MIKFNNVTKIYPTEDVVLQDISFEVKEGEFVSFVGKSGAGKTTLIRLILGLETPTSGEVYFEDLKLNDADALSIQKIRRKIAIEPKSTETNIKILYKALFVLSISFFIFSDNRKL